MSQFANDGDAAAWLRWKAEELLEGPHFLEGAKVADCASRMSDLMLKVMTQDAELTRLRGENERLRGLRREVLNEFGPLCATSPVSSNVTIHNITINGRKPLWVRLEEEFASKETP